MALEDSMDFEDHRRRQSAFSELLLRHLVTGVYDGFRPDAPSEYRVHLCRFLSSNPNGSHWPIGYNRPVPAPRLPDRRNLSTRFS